MNKQEENNYKEYAKETTPDLWDRINNNLPDGMYTKDSSIDNQSEDTTTNNKTNVIHTYINQKEEDSDSSNKVTKFPSRKIYTIAGILAACLVIVAIPFIYNGNNKAKTSNYNQEFSVKKDTANDDSSQHGISDFNDSNDITNDTSNAITDNSDAKDNINSNEATTEEPTTNNSDQKEDQTMHPIITLKVTKHHTTDIGLVYEGIITSTTSTNIKVDDSVYVTLRKLSRHDLFHTYEPGESFTISLYDDTFASSTEKPYYAYKMEN